MAKIRKRILPSGAVCWLVDYRDQNSKRRAKQFKTKREADKWLHTTAIEVVEGRHVADSDSVTVKAAVARWLSYIDDEGRGGRLEPTTTYYYETHCRLHILDDEIGIGGIKLNRVTRVEVNAFRDRLLSARSETMARRVLSTLSMVIDHAIDHGLAAVNHVRGIKVRRSSRTKERLTVPEPSAVREIIDKADQPMRQILIIAAFCGLRASEIYGLRWDDVDLEETVLRVRQRADCYGTMGEPKSAAGLRDVPFGPFVANTLREWKLQTGGRGLVFQNDNGNPLLHSNVSYRWFKPLFWKRDVETGKTVYDEATGKPVMAVKGFRFHDLRHLAVSLWIREGFGPKSVMEFAGHSSVTMTFDRYGHMFPAPADHHKAMGNIEAFVIGK